jgi:hypothetical protein
MQHNAAISRFRMGADPRKALRRVGVGKASSGLVYHASLAVSRTRVLGTINPKTPHMPQSRFHSAIVHPNRLYFISVHFT